MTRKSSRSVFDEPHLRPAAKRPDGEPPVDSVWQEPTTRGERETTPYAEWLDTQRERWSEASAWRLTLLLSLIAGPLAVATALARGRPGSMLILVVVVGPLVEEVGKIMAPLMVVERNPARFTRPSQIVVCGLMAGLVFAVIENFMYLKVYIDDPTPALVAWRWSVCVLLHTGCSLLAASGVARIRSTSLREQKPPVLETGAPRILLAVGVHGVYNLLAVLLNPLFT